MKFINSKSFIWGVAALLILAGVTFFAAQLYFSNNPSVLYKYKDRAVVDPADELYVIFNPFREKAPEVEAEKLFEHLKRGRGRQIASEVQIDCERENNYAPRSWEIADRAETSDQSRCITEFTGKTPSIVIMVG